MKTKYPVKIEVGFHSNKVVYCLEFPDLPGCATFGYSLEEALQNGEEAAEGWLDVWLDDHSTVPVPSVLEEHILVCVNHP